MYSKVIFGDMHSLFAAQQNALGLRKALKMHTPPNPKKKSHPKEKAKNADSSQ